MHPVPTLFDAIVVGAGQGGSPLARDLAAAGWKTALVEREYVGGTCVNRGCTPTKTLAAIAEVAHLVRQSETFGVESGPVSLNMGHISQRRQKIVENFRVSQLEKLKGQKNLTLLRGEAVFTGVKEMEVRFNAGGSGRIRAQTIILDTGSRPAMPKIDNLQNIDFLTSRTVLDTSFIPPHLAIVGGGYVGVEFAQMFRRLGSNVTLIQSAPQLLPQEDEDMARILKQILEEEGIRISLNARVVSVRQRSAQQIELEIRQAAGMRKKIVSHLLVATGRRPNSDHLNLPLSGVETDSRGYIKVSAGLETSQEGIFALGDVTGGAAFTHIAYDDYRVLRRRLLAGETAEIGERNIPFTIFTDPQLGRVGISEREARRRGISYMRAEMPVSQMARAREIGRTLGKLKVLIHPENQQILGCGILAPQGGELMSALQIAMMGRLPYTRLRDAAFAHPTLVESFNNLFDRTVLVPAAPVPKPVTRTSLSEASPG